MYFVYMTTTVVIFRDCSPVLNIAINIFMACFHLQLELDAQVGVVNFHLSPRQVHLLLEIAEGLAEPSKLTCISCCVDIL